MELHSSFFLFCRPQIEAVGDDTELRSTLSIDEAISLLQETGFRKPVCMLTVSDKAHLKSALLDYHCMVKVKAEMDQFSDGMQTLQVLDFIKLYPEQMRPLFVATNNVVTAGLLVKLCPSHLTIVYALIEILKDLLTVEYSAAGSNQRAAEEQSWVHFGDFLDECEGKIDFLIFFLYTCDPL